MDKIKKHDKITNGFFFKEKNNMGQHRPKIRMGQHRPKNYN
jgi:hypothetical protein